MTNKITVPSELIHRAIDAVEQVGYQDKFIDYTFVGAVKNELRAALAEPVPPAGVEPEAMPQRRSWSGIASWQQRAEINAWNAACDAWGPHVNRLQAEVERLRTVVKEVEEQYVYYFGVAMRVITERNSLQSELTKAREAWEGIVEYFPEGHSDGECFSVEKAKAVLSNQSAPAEESYPPCDYCGTVPDYHPWHGSGLINGEESPHIHACNECRAKLPAPADKGQGEPLIHITPEVLAMLRGVRKMMAGGLTYSQSKPVGNWTVPLYTEQPAPVVVEICKHCGWPHISDTESCDDATKRERGKP